MRTLIHDVNWIDILLPCNLFLTKPSYKERESLHASDPTFITFMTYDLF